MQVISFAGYPGHDLASYGSKGALYSRIADLGAQSALGVMRIEPHGLLGRHPAAMPQLMVVVSGEGWVRGEDQTSVEIRAGVAVRWNAGEHHETWTEESGLILLILEARDPNLGFQQ